MDQVRKKDAIEAEWLRNYQLIRNLYLTDVPLNDLIYWLEFFENFTVTFKSQLEYRLKKWNISKNIDRESWKYIDKTINKRKLEGKESDVLLCGKRVKQSTIEKETNRHRDTSIAAQRLPGAHVQSIASSDEIIICTPQAYLNEFEWPETLPWFKFRSKLQEWLSYIQLHRMTSEPAGLALNLVMLKMLLVGYKFGQSQLSHQIPKLAINLVMRMPEYFPGEHLQTAQIIATGTANVMMPECLKLIFYKVSNNMVSTWDTDDFENLYTLISRTGLLSATDSLRRARQQDLTTRAFMDNLFKHIIMFICFNKSMVNMEIPNTLIKWLLSLGQDPNINFVTPFYTETALEQAILSRRVDLIESLLKAGGAIRKSWKSSNLRSIIRFVLPDRIFDNEGAHIIRLLLVHYKFLTAEEILHASILLQDERLFEQALDIGADISLPIETLKDDVLILGMSNLVEEETALSTAAAVSIQATSRIFHLLQQNQSIEAASFITPDVFISAACAGNADVISFLHGINPTGLKSNARGLTPLQVAIKGGHQEAYQLLFKLYRQSSATLLLIPIFTDQLAILQFLLANGLDVNHKITTADITACQLLRRKRIPSWDFSKHKSPTVLQLLLRGGSRIDDRFHDAIKLLVRSGALFPKEAILELSRAGHDDILSSALDAGGDPNAQRSNGDSALTLALRFKHTNCVQLLLKAGAKLQTSASEVFEALLPEHVCNIQGDRARGDPRLRALLLKHWTSIFDTRKYSVLDIDAAIIAQHDSRLKSAFSELPTYYSPSSLCSAVLVENHWVIDFLVKNRSPQASHHILEGTAVGLAAMLGNLPVVRKLIVRLQKPETALLPFTASSSSFVFSSREGLYITSSHTFWPICLNDNDDFDDCRRYGVSRGSPLALAASYRGTAGVLELLSHGYEPDDITWARAFSMDTQDCLKTLKDYSLRVSSRQSSPLALSRLLRYAIQHEMKEEVVWLIESGADLNENDLFRHEGRSPVQFAIEHGHFKIAEILLHSGAKVNAAPSFFAGATSLQIAAIMGHIGLAKLLLEAGARVNAKGSRQDGRTALEGAAERGRLDMVELLLHHGAITTSSGRFQFLRAIHFAERYGHNATAALLRRSREWTDEDTHIYDSMCAECEFCFSEPRPRGESCFACDSGYTRGRYCCDEIHMPEDDCYYYYTEEEESHYERKIQEEESESQEHVELEEGI
ncbi:uncharacterized protein FPRN_15068 [Fusarium proliferatum]|nr:uncharacterized protein FPRN_15068 [Fusarium proliferatum]